MKKKVPEGQLDLFVTDVNLWYPKSDRASLEHPFFSLSRHKDLAIRRYISPDRRATLEVTPSVKGMATIYDQDILIYIMTQIRAATKKDRQEQEKRGVPSQELVGMHFVTANTFNDPAQIKEGVEKEAAITKSRPVNIVAFNLLHAIQRGTGGKQYKELEEALDRLQNTAYKTNIQVGNGYEATDNFRMIEKYKIIREKGTDRMLFIQILLSEWLWIAAAEGDDDLLAIDPEYFSLNGMERKIYSICRKHCGHQPAWNILLENLYIKSGSTAGVREFRRMIRKLVEKYKQDKDKFPRYVISYDPEKDMFWARTKAAAALRGLA